MVMVVMEWLLLPNQLLSFGDNTDNYVQGYFQYDSKNLVVLH